MNEFYSLNDTYIRRIFQLSGMIQVEGSVYGTAKYSATIIYNWLRKKFGSLRLPTSIRSFSQERGGQSVDVIYDNKEQYFCMLAQHPDEKIANRMWSIESEIIVQENNVRIGVKLSYSSPVGSDVEEPDFSIPRFVRTIALKNGIVDCWRYENKAKYISSDDDLSSLLKLLQSEERLCPVIVIAECENEYKAGSPFIKGYLLDPDKLANRLYLTAHVVALPSEFQEKFEDIVGEKYRVNNGAVRTYFPGFNNMDSDNYKRHPFTVPPVILSSCYTDDNGKDHIMGDAYLYILADRILQYNGNARVKWVDLGHKFYYAANREYLKSKISEAKDTAALNEVVKNYENELKNAEDIAYSAMEDSEKINSQLDEAKDIIRRQKAEIENLKHRLESSQGHEAVSIPIPDTYDELPDWVETNFPGRLQLLPRAIRSLKNAEFEDVHLVYKALELLGTDYNKMRTGEISREKFDEKCQALGITECPCIADNRAGELKDIYFIPDYHGHKVKIDRHIKNGGGSRNPKRCMRIYFFWDEDMQQAVICYLPQHQQIRAS